MGRDIGTALEELRPFDFDAVRPRLQISFADEIESVEEDDEEEEVDGALEGETGTDSSVAMMDEDAAAGEAS